jgi:hypothetical protein
MNAVINFEDLYRRKINHIQVRGVGVVTGLLNDDLVGHKHQRFVLELAPHKTLLILNNIDLWPRISPLEVGDRVEFYGEYAWNRHGGIVHWTHDDPKGSHDAGFIKVLAEEHEHEGAAQTPIPLGTYRHYKGKLYDVIGFAIHSETLEDMVIYRQLYGEGKTWVRPLSMWENEIEVDGRTVKRFEKAEENAI